MEAGAGFGALALCDLLSRDALAAGTTSADQVAATAPAPHFTATAKSVIFLFMEGGPSHLDLFDPKPALNRLAGQPLPASFKPVITPMGEGRAPLLASKRQWKQHGQSGMWASDWVPHIATCVDDLAMIQSCWSNGLNHVGGVCQMNTGSTLAGRPSLGSWVSYGLGTENTNLPGFVVMQDYPRSTVAGGPRNWGPGFMPAVYQGTRLESGPEPLANLRTPATVAQRGNGASSNSWTGSITGTCTLIQTSQSLTPGSKAMSWLFACKPRLPRPSTWPAKRRRPGHFTA